MGGVGGGVGLGGGWVRGKLKNWMLRQPLK